MQMFITKQGQYCPDCADTNQEVRAKLASAHAAHSLDITGDSQQIEGQTCEACQRLISEVPAHLGTYRLKAQVTFTVDVDLQARSATDAEYQLDEAVERADFAIVMQDLREEMRARLDDPDTVAVWGCQYEIEEAKRVPPEQNVFVSPAQERLMRFH